MSVLKRKQPRGAALRMLIFVGLSLLLADSTALPGAAANRLATLKIGTSGSISGGGGNEKNSLDSLKAFVKDESGLDSEITRQSNWNELADHLAKGEQQIGVFQGYEFAWAREKYPELKPLVVTVNVYVYPVAYVVARKDDAAKDFAGLQGHSVALLADSPAFLTLFVDSQCQAAGKKADAFFSKTTKPENFEDALDDVVDSNVDAAVVDRAALESFKRRKPGRFAKLKPVAQSQLFPPAVIAFYGNGLDQNTRKQFRDGLLNAGNKEKGQTMLNLFRLTGFQTPPDDFEQVLTNCRKTYPPPAAK